MEPVNNGSTAAELIDLPVFNLEGWDYLMPAEGNLDIYARGKERVIIERKTGRLITRYER